MLPQANPAMADTHDRMPAILEQADWPVWLGEAGGDPVALLRPAADRVLKLWPVSRAVNSVRNNGRELLEPVKAPDGEDGQSGGSATKR
jgi:putative SOS response-associated peptidase YedK